MKYSENAINVFKKLYYRDVPEYMIKEEEPGQVFARVANFVAGEDQKLYEAFYNMMNDGYFRPNTPCMMNAGIKENPQTSACFVGVLNDDLESILDFDREAALIFASGSGIGGNFGTLREKDAPLSSGGNSSGPSAFVRKLAATGEAVKSGGLSRRAAIMIMMFDTHPDLIEFIILKNDVDQKSLRSINISIAISDAFMEAVIHDKMWDLLGVVDGKVKSRHKAKDLFNMIINNAHKTGDPGIWFIDLANKFNGLIDVSGRFISTNPCGEQNLLGHGSCALGSINLAKFVNNGKFDDSKFGEVVKHSSRFLDYMLDKSGFPNDKYKKIALETRPIGLGIMGLADVLCLLDIPYNSQAAYEFSERIVKNMTKIAIETSVELGKERGSFPLFAQAKSKMQEVCSHFGVNNVETLRNFNWTTIAPTGTISISADCSPGMEPLFGITYIKNISDSDEKWIFVNPIFEQKYKDESWYQEAIEKIAQNSGSCQKIDCVPAEVKRVWVTAHDIHWKDRIEMQSHLQLGITNSISSTVNLPNSATVDEIREIYMLAWKKGLKGITVYRDGSKTDQPVEFNKECKVEEKVVVAKKRPKIRSGLTHEVETGHGTIFITVNKHEDGSLLEVFTSGGKNGGVSAANLEAVARLISLALQQGVSVDKIVSQLLGISDGTCVWDRLSDKDERSTQIISIPDAIAQVLHRFYVKKEGVTPVEIVKQDIVEELRCPDCGGFAILSEGCLYCPHCGSKCS